MNYNRDLEDKQKLMEEKMNAGTADMNRLTEDYLKQKNVLIENDKVLDGLKRENDRLKMQVKHISVRYIEFLVEFL